MKQIDSLLCSPCFTLLGITSPRTYTYGLHCWPQAVVRSHSLEGFASQVQWLKAHQSKQTHSNYISSQPLAASTCTGCSGHWQDTRPRREALLQDLAHTLGPFPPHSEPISWLLSSQGVFAACTCFAAGQKPPWGQGQAISGCVLSLSHPKVSEQPPVQTSCSCSVRYCTAWVTSHLHCRRQSQLSRETLRLEQDARAKSIRETINNKAVTAWVAGL